MRMTNLLLLLALPVLAGCNNSNGAPPDKETQAEMDRLSGVWKVVSLDAGAPIDGWNKAEPRVAIKEKEAYFIFLDGQKARMMERFSIDIDPSKNPKEFKVTVLEEDGTRRPRWSSTVKSGPKGPDNRVLGIYQFDGDKLVLAFDTSRGQTPEEDVRPTSFEAKADKSGRLRVALITLEKTEESVPEYKASTPLPIPDRTKR